MALVITPGMSDCERLKDSTDRLPWVGSEQEVEVVRHQAIAEESEWISASGLGEGLEEGDAVAVIAEYVGAVVASVEGMIDEAVIDGAR